MLTLTGAARLAGVSLSTGSHVISGTRCVAPQTGQAVHAAIGAVRHSPNVLPRALKTASTGSVRFAVLAITTPYLSDSICAVDSECSRLSMTAFVSDTEDNPGSGPKVGAARHQRCVDGIILVPSADAERRTLAFLCPLSEQRPRVPAETYVAGFDDFQLPDRFDPRLTLVAQPRAEIGRQPASRSVERVAAPDAPARTIRLETSIVERDPCGAPQ
jgi:DNA-binding LacI/PurR family transcriptional regulator